MPEKILTRFQQWLDALPTANWKLWWSVVLTVAVVGADMLGGALLVWWSTRHPGTALVLPDIAEHLVTSAHWLVAGFSGWGVAQFIGKRATYKSPSPDQQRADVPPVVETTTETPVATTTTRAPLAPLSSLALDEDPDADVDTPLVKGKAPVASMLFAGSPSPKALSEDEVRKLVHRDLAELAPKFRGAVEAALRDCAKVGLDAMVYEALRSDEVQRAYYALGRTVRPPTYTVTNASTAMGSWHFYGLAVDVISRSKGWGFSPAWIEHVAEIFKLHGCDWGGNWTRADLPHFQWGTLRASPSPRARQLFADGGREAVWKEVGAI
jgi:hypothetical protein